MEKTSAATEDAAEEVLIAGLYAVESVLGEGGMGAVFQVRDVRNGRRLALKRVRAQPGKNPLLLFEREYFTLSELAHPRIIEVYDYGVDADGAYYTMELLDGADLRERRNLPIREICALLCDVASSLAILHSRGLLHRDVSPRNVRCTSDGRAKLIDFGAMAPMGLTPEIVGTAPCVPPEALQLQALDGRADLYALGVVAYWMLAGRYPYPARKLADLPELWLKEVPVVDALARDIPEKLSQLVMQLISLERDGRPRTAGEVVERLSAIAGLKHEDQEGVAGAYLTTPSLVDRETLVSWAQARMQSLLDRRGQTLVIEGDSGVGRTRALDVCVAEAKRVGAMVARATASDAGRQDYGVAVALARQLFMNLPPSATRLGVQERAILAHVMEELRHPGDPQLSPERRHIQAALRDWMLGLARQHPLMFAVDDIEQVDEPSAALLAMLAHEIKRRSMIIAVTRLHGAAEGLARDVLSRLGMTFQIAALSESRTEELVRSVFGDVDNVVGVARRVHEITRGNPRDTMQLLRHLVERGVARCERAAWLLPHELGQSDLPPSMLSVFEARASGLSTDARQLAEALALTDPATLSIEDYPKLADVVDPARLFAALGVLVQSGVLLPEGDRGNRYRFAETHASEWLEQRMAPERKRALHARLAELAERRGARMQRLHHLLESGQAALTISHLVATMDADPLEYSKQTLDLLERTVVASQELGVPEVHRLALKLRVAGVSAVIADLQVFQRYAPEVLARLRRDSGLADWEELGDGLSSSERLQTALMLAQQRYDATAEPDRGFSPFDSIRRLARLLMGYVGMSGQATDRDLIKGLPSLRPFFVLSPATAVIQSVVDGELSMEEGRVSEARKSFPGVLARIAEPDGAGIEPVIVEQMKYGITYIIAAIDASRALPSTLSFADELEKVPKYRTNAWHVRRSYYRMLGRVGKVRECQRRIELLQLRDGPQPFRSVNFRSDLPACWLTDDITGLKSSFSAIEVESARFPRLRVLAELAHCHYHRLLGDYERAFEHLATALELAQPGCHLDWHYVSAAHVQLLTLLGRPEDAIRQADAYEATCNELGLDRAVLGLEIARMPALIATGRAEEARERCDRQIALAEEEGVGGILLARCHEMRARIALALGDRTGFEQWAERFADFSQAAENPAIRGQCERLIRLGSRTGVHELVLPTTPDTESSIIADRFTSATLKARLDHCIDRTERARLALSLVLQACDAKGGHLFGVRQGTLEHLGSFPERDAPETLQPALAELLEQERQGDGATVVVDEPAAHSSAENSPYSRIAELGFNAQVLLANRSGEPAIVGIVVVEQEPGQTTYVPAQVAEGIAEVLAEQGDVDPMTCFAD
jgi:tetratricopeptide (TPR) repeat protein